MSYFLSRILIKERSNLTESHFDHKNISSKRFVQIICMDTRISILGYSYLNPVIKFSEELGVFAYFEHVLTHGITPNFKWQSYFLSQMSSSPINSLFKILLIMESSNLIDRTFCPVSILNHNFQRLIPWVPLIPCHLKKVEKQRIEKINI